MSMDHERPQKMFKDGIFFKLTFSYPYSVTICVICNYCVIVIVPNLLSLWEISVTKPPWSDNHKNYFLSPKTTAGTSIKKPLFQHEQSPARRPTASGFGRFPQKVSVQKLLWPHKRCEKSALQESSVRNQVRENITVSEMLMMCSGEQLSSSFSILEHHLVAHIVWCIFGTKSRKKTMN